MSDDAPKSESTSNEEAHAGTYLRLVLDIPLTFCMDRKLTLPELKLLQEWIVDVLNKSYPGDLGPRKCFGGELLTHALDHMGEALLGHLQELTGSSHAVGGFRKPLSTKEDDYDATIRIALVVEPGSPNAIFITEKNLKIEMVGDGMARMTVDGRPVH